MSRLLKIPILLIVYGLVCLMFLGMMPTEQPIVNIMYSDSYLFILMISLFSVFAIDDDYSEKLKIYRYKKIQTLLIEKIAKFTIHNVIFILGIVIINILILVIKKAEINIGIVSICSIYLFILFEIIYLFLLSDSMKTNRMLKKYIYLFVIIMLFLICIFNNYKALTPLNPFGYYFEAKISVLGTIIYFVYFVIAIALLYKKTRRIEI